MTAAIGVAGTLSASVLAQALGRRNERDRRQAEDRSRWLTERLRVSSKFGSTALILERNLLDACAFLDNDQRAERLPGHKSIFAVPRTGLAAAQLDAFAVEYLSKAAHDGFEAISELEQLASELALVGELAEAQAANELIEALLDAVGMIEMCATANETYQAIYMCRTHREALLQASRRSLRIDQGIEQRKPRSSTHAEAKQIKP